MFNRFVGFTLALAVAVGLTVPGHRQAPIAKVVAKAVERDSPVAVQDMVVQRQANGHFYVDGMVNGQLVHFLVDTGATSVALTADDARRVGLDFDPDQFEQIGYGASGPVMGKEVVLDSVALGSDAVPNVPGVILADAAGPNVSLLGQSYLERLGSVQIRGDEMVIR